MLINNSIYKIRRCEDSVLHLQPSACKSVANTALGIRLKVPDRPKVHYFIVFFFENSVLKIACFLHRSVTLLPFWGNFKKMNSPKSY